MWEKRITHEGLHAFRVVRGTTKQEVETKARFQLDVWAERWQRKQELEQLRSKRQSKRMGWEKQADADKRAKSTALELTKEAEAAISVMRRLLPDSLAKQSQFDWKQLEDRSHFSKAQPSPLNVKSLPVEPLRSDPSFVTSSPNAKLNFVDWIFPHARKRKLRSAELLTNQMKEQANQRFSRAHSEWEQLCNDIKRENASAKLTHSAAHVAWHKEKQDFEETQRLYNLDIGNFRNEYSNRTPHVLVQPEME